MEYERKMAALNAEINLTQNLYNSFVTAKSKVNVKKGQDGNWDDINKKKWDWLVDFVFLSFLVI